MHVIASFGGYTRDELCFGSARYMKLELGIEMLGTLKGKCDRDWITQV
jgi:hypothetical protein